MSNSDQSTTFLQLTIILFNHSILTLHFMYSVVTMNVTLIKGIVTRQLQPSSFKYRMAYKYSSAVPAIYGLYR